MIMASQHVIDWRIRTKERCVESMGGKCYICGYSKCNTALEFHHLNPEEKDFGISSTRANPISWELIVNELRKCILLCSNCHQEVHAGQVILEDIPPQFNEEFADYKRPKVEYNTCKCGGQKETHKKFCSRDCPAKGILPKDGAEINQVYKELGIMKAAEYYNVSTNAIYKALKRTGYKKK